MELMVAFISSRVHPAQEDEELRDRSFGAGGGVGGGAVGGAGVLGAVRGVVRVPGERDDVQQRVHQPDLRRDLRDRRRRLRLHLRRVNTLCSRATLHFQQSRFIA